MMEVHVADRTVHKAQWKNRKVMYLGVLLSKEVQEYAGDNFVPILKLILWDLQ